jgi:hypothetical protein
MAKESYANVHHYVTSYWTWFTQQPIVSGPASSLYPTFKGIVDPAVDKASPYLKAIESHLEPRAKPSVDMNGAPATGDVSPSSS